MAPPAIAIADPDQPEIRALLAEADAYYAGFYEPEQNHLLDIDSLQEPGVACFVVRGAGRVLGFGAVAARGRDEAGVAWGEVKRMYVAPAARGRRIGRLILDRLIAHAAEQGTAVLRLETGDRQLEALSLYRSVGFREIGPFAEYPDDGTSVFMELRIG